MAITKKIKDISSFQLGAATRRYGIVFDGQKFTSPKGYRFEMPEGKTNRAKLAVVIRTAEELDEQVENLEIETVMLDQDDDAAYEATVDSKTFEATVTPRANKVTEDQALAEAQSFLGDKAVVWATNGRFRVGVTTSETGRFVEDGKLIIGTGTSAAEALRDARKRHNAKHQAAA